MLYKNTTHKEIDILDIENGVFVEEEELKLLKHVFQTNSDVLDALHWKEFSKKMGGIEQLKAINEIAIISLRKWYNDNKIDQ